MRDFFFNDTATTEIYTLSLHDALPISLNPPDFSRKPRHTMAALICGSLAFDNIMTFEGRFADQILPDQLHILNVSDRKSTRLNSSHLVISYAVFCLKKQQNRPRPTPHR